MIDPVTENQNAMTTSSSLEKSNDSASQPATSESITQPSENLNAISKATPLPASAPQPNENSVSKPDVEMESSEESQKEESKPLLNTSSHSDTMLPKPSSVWGWGGWTTAMSVVSAIKEAASEISTELANSATDSQTEASIPSANVQQNVISEQNVQLTTERLNKNQDESKPTENLTDESNSSILNQGLKALDESVDTMALGALQAIGNFWKGGIDLVHNIEHSAENFAHTIQEGNAHTLTPVILESGKEFALKGMDALKYVGKETIDLFVDDVDDDDLMVEIEGKEKEKEKGKINEKEKNMIAHDRNNLNSNHQEERKKENDENGVENVKYNGGKHDYEKKEHEDDNDEDDENEEEDVNFSHCFYIYGGPEYIEELEEVSNHHNLLITRAKKKFTNENKIELEKVLIQIKRIMRLHSADVESHDDSVLEKVKGKKSKQSLEVSSLNDERMNEIMSFRDSSVSEALNLSSGFGSRLNDLSFLEMMNKTKERINSIKTEGIHRISELCALCISNILQIRVLILSKDSFLEDNGSKMEASDVGKIEKNQMEGENEEKVKKEAEGKEGEEEGEGEKEKDENTSPFRKDLCFEKSMYVLNEAQSMASHLQSVSACFVTSMEDVLSSFQTNVDAIIKRENEMQNAKENVNQKEKLEKMTNKFCKGLEKDEKLAEEKLNESLHLMIDVLISSCVES